jgi:hypothetical protein
MTNAGNGLFVTFAGGWLRCPYRGGNWNNGGINGVFNVNLNNARSNTNTNIGGRPAFPLAGNVCMASWGYAGARIKGACFRPRQDKSWKNEMSRENRCRVTEGCDCVWGGNVAHGKGSENMSQENKRKENIR